MKNLFNSLIAKLYRKRVAGELLQILAISILVGAVASVFSTDLLSEPIFIAGAVFVGCVALAILSGRFKKPDSKEIARFLDRNYPFVEESASLLVEGDRGNQFELWQKEKITQQLEQNASLIKLPNTNFKNVLSRVWILFAVSVLIFVSKPLFQQMIISGLDQISSIELIEPTPSDEVVFPKIEEVNIIITNPAYTNLKAQKYGFDNIKAPENATIKWELKTSGEVQKAEFIYSSGDTVGFNKKGDNFEFSLKADENHIYQIALTGSDTTVFSAFKSLEIIPDQPPGFVVLQPFEKRNFITSQKKSFTVEAIIGDDYGIISTKIKATLARGSGENVRFREAEFIFDKISGIGTKKVEVSTILHADSLEMKPGDELYFYLTATDNKPASQSNRSDTYFIIYEDSSEVSIAEIVGLGIDLLPEYFRSQRQIIMDTEQLLEEKSKLSENEFGRRSESIGYDQNLLRKRYGAYLGQDDEMMDGEEGEQTEELVDDHSTDEVINEMGLEKAVSDAASAIPDEFFHDHGAAEMNTLFAASPRALLKQALDNMWNAELHLRTKNPKEALPYEYKALELLKAVQQANRQYTRKAGYELPPIDENEKRLTGTFDDFASPKSELLRLRTQNPLERLRLLIKDSVLDLSELATQAQILIAEAELADADRLFLLNKFRALENDGRNEETEEEIIGLITKLSADIKLDPVPAKRPVLQHKKGSK
ncbi:MAG: DUF4175 family protein [Balneolaceae bacterium]